MEVACGEDHSCLVTAGGHLYSMGSNAFGKLGVAESCSTPKLVEGVIGVTHVSCGWNHTADVLRDGGCYTWGQSEFG